MKLLPAAFKLPEPIRPRRCPAADCDNGTVPIGYDSTEETHSPCDGLGFLYPDPPDWWGGTAKVTNPYRMAETLRVEWEDFCVWLWRVLRITEDTDE